MELDWSEQSPHIRSLFRPWQPSDGYDEATIQATEGRLDVRLPAILRNFYRAWGRRKDLTQRNHPLLSPDELLVRAGVLLFWVENQACWSRGIPLVTLGEADPPVMITEGGSWKLQSEREWKPSHAHLSRFLDDVTYLHAFDGGAMHGGWTLPNHPGLPRHHVAWLEAQWSKATASPWIFGIAVEDPAFDAWPSVYVRDGQAFYEFGWSRLAVREAKVVDEIKQRFQITWRRRW